MFWKQLKLINSKFSPATYGKYWCRPHNNSLQTQIRNQVLQNDVLFLQHILAKEMLMYCNNNNSKVIMVWCSLRDYYSQIFFICFHFMFGNLTWVPLYLFFLVFHLYALESGLYLSPKTAWALEVPWFDVRAFLLLAGVALRCAPWPRRAHWEESPAAPLMASVQVKALWELTARCVGAQSQLISLLVQDPVRSVQDLPL